MNKESKELIQSRARRLMPYLADYLQHNDPTAYEEGHGYRYCFLLLKGPRAFLQAFMHGELYISPAALERIFWEARGEIPGQHGISLEEREIIARHNHAVDDFLARNERKPPAVSINARQASLLC